MRTRRGITILELIVVMLTLGLLGMFSIQGILKARDRARESACAYKLRKIMRGVNRYESQNDCYPPGRLFPDWEINGQIQTGYTNYSFVSQTENVKTGFYSVHTWILPFVGAQDTFDMIDFSRAQSKRMTNPENINFDAYTKPMPLYLCPNDSNTGRGITENNYRYNFGGSTPGAGLTTLGTFATEPGRFDSWFARGNGAFSISDTEQGFKMSEYPDGLTYTAFFSERTKGTGEADPNATEFTYTEMMFCPSGPPSPAGDVASLFEFINNNQPPPLSSFTFRAAGRWPDDSDFSEGWPFGFYTSTQYNHVAPPNWQGVDCGTSFINDTPVEHAVVTARSQHRDCVNVAFGDGHVRKIRDNIDLDIWRAMGSRNEGDTVIFEKKKKQRRRRPWR